MWNSSNAFQNQSARCVMGIALLVALLVGYQAWRYFSKPPELKATAEATKTLDAMFTALSVRDRARLAACMDRVEQYSSSGELGHKATAHLRYCAKLADDGAWEEAAKHLYWMVYEQPR